MNMIVFSTLLDVNKTMTKDVFIKLVLESNGGNPNENDTVRNMTWNGEQNVRYGDENRWLDIEEYRNQNIIAVRYETREAGGVVWDTDYVMNFRDMKMAVRLDRSFTEEARSVDPEFSTPHFLAFLIGNRYIRKDGKLPVRSAPTVINDDNIQLLADIINGNTRCRLPVVYVSKTFSDEEPVNTELLADRLKGVAHVLVQESNATNDTLRQMCDDQNEYYGAVGIYYANHAVGHRRYMYHSSIRSRSYLLEKIVRSVIESSNAHLVDPLYTWQGVNNALLRERLLCQKEEREEIERERREAIYELLELKENLDKTQKDMYRKALADAKSEADKILDGFEADMQKSREDAARLARYIEKLECENAGLRAKIHSDTSIPFLFMGNEHDFYPGEIKDLVLSSVKNELDRTEPATRRYDVLNDVMRANDYQGTSKKRAAEAKRLLSNYSGMTQKLRRGLEDIGYVLDTADHQKAKYYGDDRYTVIYASTPGDKEHAGKNNASITVKKAF